MSLQKFCAKPIVTVAPQQTIVEACRLLHDKNVGCLIVTEGGTLRGILTDRDIALKVIAEGKDPQETHVHDVMTANPAHITMDKTVHDLTALMHERHVRRVPIVDGGGLVVGLMTLDDLAVLLGQELADLGKGIAVALFSKPPTVDEPELVPPFGWLMSYL